MNKFKQDIEAMEKKFPVIALEPEWRNIKKHLHSEKPSVPKKKQSWFKKRVVQ